MQESYINNAAVYMIDTLFGVYLFLLMLRFLLQLSRASFYNPISQMLVKVTNPLLVPLRRVVPGLWGVDMASLVLLLALQLLALLLASIAAGISFSLPALAIMSVAELMSLLVNVYLISILAQVILSWVGPGGGQPINDLLYSLNEPVLGPLRRRLPTLSGLDFSPLVAIMLIQLLKILLVAPIIDLARTLA